MDLDKFKSKHKDLIEKRVITFSVMFNHDIITIDRYVDGNFICEGDELRTPRSDVRKMGYWKGLGIGSYCKLH